MRVLIKLALIAASTVSGAVFAQDPKPTESPTPIYFYRIKQFAGGGLEPSVYCDDKELARMDNGRYFGVTLETRQTHLQDGRQADRI